MSGPHDSFVLVLPSGLEMEIVSPIIPRLGDKLQVRDDKTFLVTNVVLEIGSPLDRREIVSAKVFVT